MSRRPPFSSPCGRDASSLLIPLVLAAGLLFCLPATLPAQSPGLQVNSLTLGLDSRGQPGRWLPLQLDLSGLPGGTTVQVTVSAPDPRGDMCESLCAEQTVAADGTVRLEGVFCSGRLEGLIRLALSDSTGTPLWQHDVVSRERGSGIAGNPPVASENLPQHLIMSRQSPVTLLTVGEQAGLAELESLYAAEPATRDLLQVLSLESERQLPSMPRGLDSVDALLLTDTWGLTEAQGAAVREWVLAGGHLIVSCGSQADALLQSPIGRWIQPKFGIPQAGNTLQTLDLTAIQNFVVGAVALQTNRNPVTVLRMSAPQPKVLVRSLSDPLISRTTAGAGLITVAAVSLNTRPLDQWLSLPRLHEMLLFGSPQSGRTEQTRAGGRIASVGITDLSTQLAAVADALPDSERWSTWQVMALMAGLLVLAGPVDYFVVVRVLNAPRLTWVTLPLLIATGCLFTVQGLNSQRDEFSARDVSLLDVFEDAGEQRLRARTWASLSSRTSRYARTKTTDAGWLQEVTQGSGERSLMWSGRIENIFGGMYRPGGAGLGQLISRHVEKRPLASEFTALPLIADGSTSLLTDRRGTAASGRTLIQSTLRLPANALLEGTFSHRLPGPISNWAIICGNRIYSPSERAADDVRQLEPGEVWSREQGGIRVLEIRDFLRGVRLTAASSGTGPASQNNLSMPQKSWDVGNRNPLDILLMASLYESAGGRAWVQLRSDALRRDELSDTIALNTALLVGMIAEPLSDVQVDEHAVRSGATATVVRLFLPVERIAEDRPQAETSNSGAEQK
ncbi:MAG: hypothetical protein ACKO2P_12020 [Planctomycetota bacterium]